MKWREILKAPLIPRTKSRKKENQITFQATDQYLIMDIWKNKVNICRHAVDRKTWEYGTYYVGSGKKRADQSDKLHGRIWRMLLGIGTV